MSIASEISRLQGAKADLKTAIEGKGVTVSSATKLDGYADLVDAIQQGGGGSTLITKNISANGTYNASSDSADGYSQVTVAVPASAVDTGTKNITANGSNQDVVGYAAVDVAVPNSYSASDEGKVVSNGALVAQTAHADVTPTTSDQTIDTTTNNSIKVKGDADLVATNIKKDVEIFGITGSYEGGGGGSSKESGSFVVSGSNVRSFTIPVTSQKTHVQVCIHGFVGSTDLSDAPYGANHLIYACMDDTLKLYTSAATNYDGKNTTGGIGRGFPQYASFGSTSIASGDLSVGGSSRYMVDGATYDWEAW